MRFRRIEIPAYGPFTDFSAEFPRGEGDFHLVYGPNEAGKSSLLRAMRALLFGIHRLTTDNFRHDYPKLHIRAKVEDAAGKGRVFQRRKGKKDTLLDERGTAIPERELRDMLGSVDAAYFDSMFGLGSEELKRGADELLRGEGRLGEALFSASLGGTPVDRVVQALEEEAGAIFAGRAQRRIREALRKFNEHQQGKKDHLIKSEAWEEIERGLGERAARLAELTAARRERFARKEWLERCRGALPIVGQLAERRRRIEALPDLPDLPRGFAEQIREAQSAWQTATEEVERIERERERQRAKLEACDLRPEILAEAGVIDRLHTDLGTYRETRRGAEAKAGEASAKERAVSSACRELGIAAPLDRLEPLRLSLPEFNETERLARRLQSAEGAVDDAERSIDELGKELESHRAQAAQGDPAQLARLTELIHRAAAVEATAQGLPARAASLDALERSVREHHRHLAGAPEDPEAVGGLPVPTRARIEEFRDRIEESRREIRSIEEEKRTSEETIRQTEAEIERRARQGEIPSLDDLEAGRRHRDRGWELVLRAWKGAGAEESLMEGQPLEEAYPEAVAQADKIADRLRLEAEAVAQLEALRSTLRLETGKKEDLESRLTGARNAGGELSEQWNAAWKGCRPDPQSPREMLEWRETWQEFRRLWDQWTADRGRLAADREAVDAVAAALAETLGVGAGGFEELLAMARERRDRLDAARDEDSARAARIRDLERDLATARESLPRLRETLESAQGEWGRRCEALSLSAATAPETAIEALRLRREMFRDYDLWQALLAEAGTMRESVVRFEEAVLAAGAKLGLVGDSAELLETALWAALESAKKAQIEHDGLLRQIDGIDESLAAARQGHESARQAFDGLFAQTGLTDPAALGAFISQVEELRGHRDKVTELRDHLAGFARGQSVDEFIERVQTEDAASLDGDIAGLVEELEQLDRDIEAARAAKQDWEHRRTTMENAQDTAARHEQNAAFAASSMRADAERFVRLRVAIDLLRSQLDAFREQNQGPFLEKASRWFSEITGGAFRGIGTSYRNGDDPVIAGLRGDASGPEEVLVSGMSEGTRDQLYLALRFAGLELHLQDHEPMPMILDDLLVHFDDGRAANALAALAKFGRQSQVILFTHHAHLVELARARLGAEGFHLAEIG